MNDINPLPVAIDQLESFVADGRYPDPCSVKSAIRVVLDELNRAAGEIVTLREQAKDAPYSGV